MLSKQNIEITTKVLSPGEVEHVDEWFLTTLTSINNVIDNNKNLEFAVSFRLEELPECLSFLCTDRANLYNIIGLHTITNHEIPTHVDDDLIHIMRKQNIPSIYVKPPIETTVYYLDICKQMRGGELVFEQFKFKPESNTLITFPGNLPHSVSSIDYSTKPRLSIVCEKYKLYKTALKEIKTPNLRVDNYE